MRACTKSSRKRQIYGLGKQGHWHLLNKVCCNVISFIWFNKYIERQKYLHYKCTLNLSSCISLKLTYNAKKGDCDSSRCCILTIAFHQFPAAFIERNCISLLNYFTSAQLNTLILEQHIFAPSCTATKITALNIYYLNIIT